MLTSFYCQKIQVFHKSIKYNASPCQRVLKRNVRVGGVSCCLHGFFSESSVDGSKEELNTEKETQHNTDSLVLSIEINKNGS